MPLAALFAGMPRVSAVLSEPARLRVEVVSFFLLVLLLSAAAIRWLWNGLARDFPRLPRLTYRRSVGVVGLWGALFVLVLTMISGARELMTPGAWKPDGVTYSLATVSPTTPVLPAGPSEDDRRRKLDALRAALRTYAEAHDGLFPDAASHPAIPAELWQTPHASGTHYLYAPGQAPDAASRRVVAYEPQVFGEYRFALLADGDIRRVTTAALQDLLAR